MVARADGTPIVGPERDRVNAILSRSEWPTWDYGPVKPDPVMPA